MITSRHITKIAMAAMAVVLCLCLAAMSFADALTEAAGGKGVAMEYETALFDTSEIVEINILIDEDSWADMLENAISEQYYECDVELGGETFKSVGIRPKGNTSLSSIASDPTTDRYSFKLEFDKYVEGQTCFGLDKLVLNNNYADATNMKEALVYDMYAALGADASLYNYAKVSVNGEYWGVYLALEAVEESFILRNYGTEDGELYKPDSMDMGGGKGGGDKQQLPDGERGDAPEDMPQGGFSPRGDSGAELEAGATQETPSAMPGSEAPTMPEGAFAGMPDGGFGEMPEGMPDMSDFDPSEFSFGGGGMGGFSRGGGGANLEYSDDDLDSYSTIWDGEVTKTSDTDHRRVVTALRNISEGRDIEKYLDVDNILKYMAAHIFACNEDSLSGSMAHNYYLYEYDGRLNILPWDYNLSWGGMGQGGGASDVVNDPIDDPFSGTDFFDVLLENEEYLERYHGYLRKLYDIYITGGRLDETYSRIRSQIDALVETDPTAFYSYEEYDLAAETLYKVLSLRFESVLAQLDGAIPSTEAAQREDSSTLIDASDINIDVMGTMNMGGGGKGEREITSPPS